jgi:DNA excision repair protein ERCC-1
MITPTIQSFSDIAKATPGQLQNLPGFGQVKVRRTKEAFEKPFRNKATTTLFSSAHSQAPNTISALQGQVNSGRATPNVTEMEPSVGALQHAGPGPRESSPFWDIDLDLNSPPPN